MKKQRRGRWTPEIASAEVSRWRKSGLSAREYAARRGFDVQRLYWWARRVDSGSSGRAQRFAEVVFAPTPARESRTGIVVHIRGGHHIVVEAGFDPEALRSVVAALSEAPPC